jgi:hypothetical protein
MTHEAALGHEIPAMALMPGGGVAVLHVTPPSLLATKAAALCPVPSAPLAMHVLTLEHDTSKRDAE